MSTVYASPIWLGRPHCPVTVTTGAGAVVTAALGSLTLTATADANGLCAMKLPRRGRWSFTAVLGGKKGFGTLAVPGQRSLSLPLYSTTLAENSWAEIAAAAAAGIAARLWSPGDVKELTISGTAGLLTVTDLTIGAIILGFDHNAALEGSGRIHFQLARLGATPVALVDKRHGSFSDLAGAFTMNTTATSEGGWQGCHMRQEILGSDSSDYVIRSCALDDIVRPAVRRFAGEFIQRKIQLNYQMLNYTVITDEKWLGFVVEQVLSNALKYTPQGSVSIYMEPEGVLCIRDTGIGIAPEDLPRVFEKGYTGYNGRSHRKASGLGLYLCREILTRLGHSVSAESQVDHGTTIRIDLRQHKTIQE